MAAPQKGPSQRMGSRSGFTLLEACIGGVIAVFAMGALTYTCAALFTTVSTPQLSYNGTLYSRVPSYGDFRAAMFLNFDLANEIDRADSVLVFGGSGTNPSSDPTGPSSVLALGYVPTSLTAMAAGGADPAAQFSSWAQRSANSAQLAGQFVAAGSSSDLTIVTVQGLSQVTSVTQQRKYTTTFQGVTYDLYFVQIQEITWSGGIATLVTNPDTGLTPTYQYAVYLAQNEDIWQIPPGATHYWFRIDSTWNRTEEGPCTAVLVDPFVLGSTSSSAQVGALSRFTYSIPVVQ